MDLLYIEASNRSTNEGDEMTGPDDLKSIADLDRSFGPDPDHLRSLLVSISVASDRALAARSKLQNLYDQARLAPESSPVERHEFVECVRLLLKLSGARDQSEGSKLQAK